MSQQIGYTDQSPSCEAAQTDTQLLYDLVVLLLPLEPATTEIDQDTDPDQDPYGSSVTITPKMDATT